MPRRNWSGHVTFAATDLQEPRSVPDLQALVAASPRIRAIGSGHAFNDLADTSGVQVSVARLPQDIEIDTAAQVVRAPGGMRYGDLARLLDAKGWAVHNMASLGHISVAGTIATGTHGSGDRNQTLSAAVRCLELVTASGDVLVVTTDDADLNGWVVSLGTLGIVTSVHLAIEPAFTVRQYVFDDVRHATLLDRFDEAFGSAYSVSFFTTWAPDLTGQVWMKRRDDTEGLWPSSILLDGHLADGPRHPLPGHDAVHCTAQGGDQGSWHDRLPHFRLDFTPSSGDELQTEYLVARQHAVDLLRAVESMAPRIHPLLHVSEIRTMASDRLWLSGAYGRDTVGIHFTWQRRPEVLGLLADLDDLLGGRDGRPHWGKLYEATDLGARYPRFDEFVRLAYDMDPTGRFRNSAIDRILGG